MSIRSAKGAAAFVIFLILMVLFTVPPESLPLPECAFHALTGYSCFTCGLTRSLYACSRGDLGSSFRLHLMGPPIFGGLIALWALLALEAATGKSLGVLRWNSLSKRILVFSSLVWLVYWGGRLLLELAT